DVQSGRLWMRTGESSWLPGFPQEPVWISTVPGDVIVFDPRLVHAGSDVAGSKLAVFFAVGSRNSHAQLHFESFGGRRLDGSFDDTRAAFREVLKQHSLLLNEEMQ